MTLKEQLDAYQAKARAKRPPEVQAIMDRETDNLRRSGIADRALRMGATAPAFALPNAMGKTVRSADLLAKGPLVISFYRGEW